MYRSGPQSQIKVWKLRTPKFNDGFSFLWLLHNFHKFCVTKGMNPPKTPCGLLSAWFPQEWLYLILNIPSQSWTVTLFVIIIFRFLAHRYSTFCTYKHSSLYCVWLSPCNYYYACDRTLSSKRNFSTQLPTYFFLSSNIQTHASVHAFPSDGRTWVRAYTCV